MLYPINTESRGVIDLNGIWKFKLDQGNGSKDKWYESGLTDTLNMAVPASYNDIGVLGEIRYLTGGKNRITVAANNIVDESTLPVGIYKEEEVAGLGKVVPNSPNFDFFNYAGIHRPVKIYTTPYTYISDVAVVTGYNGTTGRVDYQIKNAGEQLQVKVSVLDEANQVVSCGEGAAGMRRLSMCMNSHSVSEQWR